MAERTLAELIDCLEGIVSEQGYEGLANYTKDPERLMAEAAGAKDLLHGYAFGESAPTDKVGQTVYIEETGKGRRCAAYRVVCEGRFARHETAYEALRKLGWAHEQIRLGGNLSQFA